MPNISVIVPIYNAEKYLCKCVDSILSQTFTDFELLLIDDGSTDKSGQMCDEYAAKDFRIRVFHKQNGGVSSARNIGIDNASGQWVIFIDSDDSIGSNYLDSKKWGGDYDLIIFSYITNNKKYSIGSGDVIIPSNYVNDFFSKNLGDLVLRTPWGKAYKRELIGSIRFDRQLRMGEDTVFNLQYYQKCNTIFITDLCQYHYTQTDQKSRYHFKVDDVVSIFTAISKSYQEFQTRSKDFEHFLYYWFRQLLDDKKSLRIWHSNSQVKRFYFRYIAKNARMCLSYYKQWAMALLPTTRNRTHIQ